MRQPALSLQQSTNIDGYEASHWAESIKMSFQLPILSFQALFDLYLGLGTAVAVVVIGWFLYNIIKHREREHMPLNSHAEGKPETWKTALTMVLVTASILATVEIGTFLATHLVVPPTDNNPIYIQVTARQFEFDFTYPNGNLSHFHLTIPAGREIILNVTSTDVHHALGIDIPGINFVKIDAIPGQYNTGHFIVPQTGTFIIRCYQLCGGTGHTFMKGDLHVVDPSAYAQLNFGG